MAGYKTYEPTEVTGLPPWLNWVAGPTDVNQVNESIDAQRGSDLRNLQLQEAQRQTDEQNAISDVFKQNPEMKYSDMYDQLAKTYGAHGDAKALQALDQLQEARRLKEIDDHRANAALLLNGGDLLGANAEMSKIIPGSSMVQRPFQLGDRLLQRNEEGGYSTIDQKPGKPGKAPIAFYKVDGTTGERTTHLVAPEDRETQANLVDQGFLPLNPSNDTSALNYQDAAKKGDRIKKALADAQTPQPGLLDSIFSSMGLQSAAPNPAAVTIPKAAPTPVATSAPEIVGTIRRK